MNGNSNLQTIMKVTAGLCVFAIFVCSLNQADTMMIAWMLSITTIIMLFFIDAYYIKRNKLCEIEIYQLEVNDLESKKRMAEITGGNLPDAVMNGEITEPTEQLRLPIIYYAITLVIDIMIKVVLIH